MSYIKDNLSVVLDNIKLAAKNVNRNPENITLIGVTKTIDIPRMEELRDLGIKNFGENKVQELQSKYDYFEKSVDWHLIGHLQTNKVKYIIDKTVLIHSVDSVKLAQEIDKRAKQIGICKDILVEVNIGNEESKFGVLPSGLNELIDGMKHFENIKIKGLMTVAPFVSDPEDNRECFKNMKALFEKLPDNQNVEPEILSMGMTNDYIVAIEEGSNMIRVGTAIFGKREYK